MYTTEPPVPEPSAFKLKDKSPGTNQIPAELTKAGGYDNSLRDPYTY